MKSIKNKEVYERIYGIQLAVFEIIWPKPWLSAILIKESENTCFIFTKTSATPGEEEWLVFEELMGEILTEAFKDIGVHYEIKREESSSLAREYDIIMDEEIFTAIAKDHAPWRLEQ
jgi:hypothetical protein